MSPRHAPGWFPVTPSQPIIKPPAPITDENGDYTLSVAEGTYTVTVTADGFIGDDQAGVVVNSEESVTGIDFSLVLDV